MARGTPNNPQEARLYLTKLVIAATLAVRVNSVMIRSRFPRQSDLARAHAESKVRTIDLVNRAFRDRGLMGQHDLVFMTRSSDQKILEERCGLAGFNIGKRAENLIKQPDGTYLTDPEGGVGAADPYHVLETYRMSGNKLELDVRAFIFGDLQNGEEVHYVLESRKVTFDDNKYTLHFEKGDPRVAALIPIVNVHTRSRDARYVGGVVQLSKGVIFSIAHKLKRSGAEGLVPPWAYCNITPGDETRVDLDIYLPDHH